MHFDSMEINKILKGFTKIILGIFSVIDMTSLTIIILALEGLQKILNFRCTTK